MSRHIIVSGEQAMLVESAFVEGKVQFSFFHEKCDDCGKPLEDAKIDDTTQVVCACGKKYDIIASGGKPTADKKEKPVKKSATTKVEKTKEKPVKKSAPKTEKTRAPREGSISQTALVASDKAVCREGSCAEMILKTFKKAAVPAKVVDKLVEQWKKTHDSSATFKKNPRGYMMWTVLDLLRKGSLKKA